jgi:catechol 2,3-dioxygenase-like lactoylglutathione lyase family enzyme
MAPRALAGINHVAVVTADLDRFTAFYGDLFEIAVVAAFDDEQGRHAVLDVGGGSFLHAFEQRGNRHAEGHHEMFDRGHIDHLALAASDAASFDALREELVRRGLSDGAVNEFGVARSVYFEDPDGMGCEVLLMQVDLATILDQVQTTSS